MAAGRYYIRIACKKSDGVVGICRQIAFHGDRHGSVSTCLSSCPGAQDKKIDATRAIASALAMLGNPDPGKRFGISAGMGFAGSEAAFAGGVSLRIVDSPEIGAVFKGGVGFASDESSGGAFTFSF